MNTTCVDCGKLSARTRCQLCHQRFQQGREARRGTAAQRGYGSDWRTIRLKILERDGHTCRWCGAPATSVDHLLPLARGGPRLDERNLLASCLRCNSVRGGAESRGGRGAGPIPPPPGRGGRGPDATPPPTHSPGLPHFSSPNGPQPPTTGTQVA